jgi:large subunit ribosomal protein L4
MQLEKYTKDGKVTGKVEGLDSVFSAEINDVLIYELVKSLNANLHQGTHKTKERSDVRGGGVKPWRQKGTGRARQGSIRAPQWKGGGTVFGPRVRSYKIDMPKKLKQMAYRSLFSLKAKEGKIKIIEDFSVQGKSKEMAAIGKLLSISKGVFITSSEDTLIKRSMRNIPWFTYNNVKRVSGLDLFYSKDVIITESALKIINEKYSQDAN